MKSTLMFTIMFGFSAFSSAQAISAEVNSCGPRQHECACATGSYCLRIGEACMVPTTSCPTNVTSYEAPMHSCACATGSYELPLGYACEVPTAACPSN